LATAVELATVKIQTTILALVGTPTATEVLKTAWTPINSRDACKNSEAGNSMEGGQLQQR
jgi:hypothetical protein